VHKESKVRLAQRVQSVLQAQLAQQVQLPQSQAQQVQQAHKDNLRLSMIIKSKQPQQLVTQAAGIFFTTMLHKQARQR
jgi:hypothetical protein